MTLFNEYEAMNEAAGTLADEVEAALAPIVLKAQQEGYPLRQVECVLNMTVSTLIGPMVLRAAMAKRRAEREAHDAHRSSTTT